MSRQPDKTIEALLREKLTFPPPKAFARQADVRNASICIAPAPADRNALREPGSRRPSKCADAVFEAVAGEVLLDLEAGVAPH